ncbi:hypothetical protein ACFQ0D_33015, partial [Micromonospora zhanjiangensis]
MSLAWSRLVRLGLRLLAVPPTGHQVALVDHPGQPFDQVVADQRGVAGGVHHAVQPQRAGQVVEQVVAPLVVDDDAQAGRQVQPDHHRAGAAVPQLLGRQRGLERPLLVVVADEHPVRRQREPVVVQQLGQPAVVRDDPADPGQEGIPVGELRGGRRRLVVDQRHRHLVRTVRLADPPPPGQFGQHRPAERGGPEDHHPGRQRAAQLAQLPPDVLGLVPVGPP